MSRLTSGALLDVNLALDVTWRGRLIYGNTGTAFNTNTNTNINMPQEPYGKRKEGGDLRVFSCFIKCTQISLLATVADSST